MATNDKPALAKETLSSFDTQQIFRELLEAAPDAMVLVNQEGKIVFVNSQTETLFGHSKNELLGSDLEMLIPKRFHADHVSHRTGYSKKPAVRRMGSALELFGQKKSGEEFPVEVSLSPLVTPSGTLIISAIRDNSVKKLAEDRIRASLHEKEVLLKEVHHRVKNNLQVINSILNLQADTIADEKVRDIFNDTRARIRSIALVHERLYQTKDLSNIDFGEYVDGLVSDLFRAFGIEGGRISYSLEIKYSSIPIDKTVNCGLIINEIISNSLKYAFPDNRVGNIEIKLEKDEKNFIHLWVGDDGIGLPSGFDYRKTDSLGLKLVNGLSSEIGGKIDVETKMGTKFHIMFPLNG